MTSKRALLFAFVLIGGTSLYVNFYLSQAEAVIKRNPVSSFPKEINRWNSSDEVFSNAILENLKVDEYVMRRYADGKNAIWMYIGYYKNQRGEAVPHSPRHCYPGSGFTPISNKILSIPVTSRNFSIIRPNLYVFAKGNERDVVIYWYQSRGRVIANEYTEKLFLIRDAILKNRTDGALIRFSMSATPETLEMVTATLTKFISEIYPQIPLVVPD